MEKKVSKKSGYSLEFKRHVATERSLNHFCGEKNSDGPVAHCHCHVVFGSLDPILEMKYGEISNG